VEHLHWVILIPYYFIGTLAALPLLVLICRLLQLKVAIHALVGAAIGLTVAAIVIPLIAGWLSLSAFTGRPMLVLLLLSFVFAAADTALYQRRPLPLDRDLQEL
jgi:hypothetical protein